MRRGSRLLCIGIAACMMCGCGILPTEEEFDAAPLVKEYSDENVGKYTVTRGDMFKANRLPFGMKVRKNPMCMYG